MTNLICKIKNRVLFITIKYFHKSINKYLFEVFNRFKFIPDVVSNPINFEKWEKLGYHITSTHFYQALPIISEIKDEFWSTPLTLDKINLQSISMINLLNLFQSKFKNDYDKIPIFKEQQVGKNKYYIENGNFTSVDSEILYCMIREFNPKNIIEIGSGYTTILISETLKKFSEYDNGSFFHTAIDPYPRDFTLNDLPSNVVFFKQKVEETDLVIFKNLKENDILFIDSSHVFKYDNDVYFEILKILPCLQKGVLIHFHDIFLPFHYPKTWIYKHKWVWNEQYFLLAFLMYNNSFETIWSGSYIHHNFPEELEKAFQSYKKESTLPGSFWIRKIK